jgi:hypothetical protein
MSFIRVRREPFLTQAKSGWTVLALSCSLSLGSAGCGGGSNASTPPPPPAADFSVSASPSPVNVAQGGTSAPVTVSITGKNGFTGTVSVAISGLPAGASTTPASPLSMNANSSQQFTVTSVVGAPTGSSTLTLSGTSGTLAHNTTTTLDTNFVIPTSWTPTGVDYGIKKQCIRTVFPTQPNFYADDVDCPGSQYPTSGYWTTAVETET